jgi:hypothetical protein
MCENVQRLCPKLWRQMKWLLHNDNWLSHTPFLTRGLFTKNNMTLIPHTTQLPDIAICEFSVSPAEDKSQKSTILTQLWQSRQNCKQCWTLLQNMTSRMQLK